MIAAAALLLAAGAHLTPPAPPPPPRRRGEQAPLPSLYVPGPVMSSPPPPPSPYMPRDAVAVEQVADWTIADEGGRCSASMHYPGGRVLRIALSPVEDRLTIGAGRAAWTKADWNGAAPIAIAFSNGARLVDSTPQANPGAGEAAAELALDFEGEATLDAIATSRTLSLIAGGKVIELFPLEAAREMADHLESCAIQSRRTPPPAPFDPGAAAARSGVQLASADLSGLISAADYPAVSLRKRQEGIVRYRLHIGSNGLVLGCAILNSSGFLALDAATCQILRERARFTPAQDARGKPVEDLFFSEVNWALPPG